MNEVKFADTFELYVGEHNIFGKMVQVHFGLETAGVNGNSEIQTQVVLIIPKSVLDELYSRVVEEFKMNTEEVKKNLN